MPYKIMSFLVSLSLFLNFCSPLNSIEALSAVRYPLKFKADGTFKIVQFTDIHSSAAVDKGTDTLINNILDYEKPDLVVITGDIINPNCRNFLDVQHSMENVLRILGKKDIPFAAVLGQHDGSHGQINKEEIMQLYMTPTNSLCQFGPSNINGIGNYNILINSSRGNAPAFNIYMLDSDTGLPTTQDGLGWIRSNQIDWYTNTALTLRKRYGYTIPALMFFHTPLPEFKELWSTGKVVGVKNQEEHAPSINSGLFDALVDTGDVKGVFVGHDHINDYVGSYNGITLGYGRVTGYTNTLSKEYARGARVFLIKESDPSKFETWVRLESDF